MKVQTVKVAHFPHSLNKRADSAALMMEYST